MAFALTVVLNLAALSVLRPVCGKEVCYDVVGCFNNNPPFDNAGNELPASPVEVGTKFHLYTIEKRDIATSLFYTQPVSITNSNFRSDRPTKIVIHGLNKSEKSEWIINMRKALLLRGDYNVIVVHWHDGARLTNYAKATANVRLVATQIKVLLNLIQRTVGLQLEDVHIIGHSLGAHVSGYVGTLMGDQIGRITGLDPADPNFEDLPYVIRLDPTDARFVDVIHTGARDYANIAGLGLMQQSGHIDFYVNGGEKQNGCEDGIKGLISGFMNAVTGKSDKSLLSSAGKGASCSHSRAHAIFMESMNSTCKFTSFPCDSYEKFLRGECYGCGSTGCSEVGWHATDHPTAKGKHYLMTNPDYPYCGAFYYNLLIEVEPGQDESKADISVQLRSKTGSRSRKISLMGNEDAKLGKQDINMPILLDKPLRELGKEEIFIELTYKIKSTSWSSLTTFWKQKSLKIEAITLTEVATGIRLSSPRRVLSLNDKIGYVITLKPEIYNGLSG